LVFAKICFYPAFLILLGVSFVKIVQIVSVLGAIDIYNVLAILQYTLMIVPVLRCPMTSAIQRRFSPQLNALVDKI
jgi:hypothetical protein